MFFLPMMNLFFWLYILAAILPALFLMVFIYRQDKVEKEPPRLLLGLFLRGVLAAFIASILERIASAVLNVTPLTAGSLSYVAVFAFLVVAAVEEGFKYLFLNTIRKNPEFNYVFDGIVYAVAVALGFAALENVFYVFDGGLEVAAMRAVFSVPGHCADGVVMGCFFGLAKRQEMHGRKASAKLCYLLAFVLPVIEHGFYDTALSTENEFMAVAAMAFQLAFILFAGLLVSRISKTDSPIHPNPGL